MHLLNGNYLLSGGVRIPKIGFGTWQIPDHDAPAAVKTALEIGYRHIDTAAAYQNERGVAQGIRKSGITRDQIFITTKIPAEIKTYEEAKTVMEQSLRNLETDYIDLMLIHAPKPWAEMVAGSDHTYFAENLAVWKGMEEAYKAGALRAIGVSNFEIADIEHLTDHSQTAPVVNQIKYHIGWTQNELTAYCKQRKILVAGYSPNATGALLEHEAVAAIAEKYGRSVSQLCIRYVLQKDVLPLPKSVHEQYIRENLQVEFEISRSDMRLLDCII